MIAAQGASAYVECDPVKVTSVMATDNGSIYISWVNLVTSATGMGGIAPTTTTGGATVPNNDYKNVMALATTALSLDLPVTIRLANGSSCTAALQPITGLQLNRS